LPHLAHRRCRRWAGPAPERSGGPPTTRGLLTLRVLRSAPGLAEAVLLALDPPGVPGEQARLLEGVTQVGIELDQPAGDTESKGVHLPGDTATFEGGVDVVATLGAGDLEWLHHPHALGHGGEIRLERATVEGELPTAFTEADPGDGLLAAASGLDERLRHQDSTFRISNSRGDGFWASWG